MFYFNVLMFNLMFYLLNAHKEEYTDIDIFVFHETLHGIKLTTLWHPLPDTQECTVQ